MQQLGLACLVVVLGACSGGEERLSCEGLTVANLGIKGLDSIRTQSVAAANGLPAHCIANGALDTRTGVDGKRYAIGFELRMPDAVAWNGKFFFQANGGTGGVVVPALGNLVTVSQGNALSRGYAVVSTDSGHDGGALNASFGLDPQARRDYGYNALGRVTTVAKRLIEAHHGRQPDRSYIMGCSNGGRTALVAASRFSDEFDGYVALSPGLNMPKALIAMQHDTQQVFAAASRPGELPGEAFPARVLSSVAERILARCDRLDGLADGMVLNPQGCFFDLQREVPICTPGASSNCLTAAQKTALSRIFAGPRSSSGAALYTSWPWDPGLAGANWRAWKLDSGTSGLPINTLIGADTMGYVFTTPPDALARAQERLTYQLQFDLDTALFKVNNRTAVFAESAEEFMNPPNPSRAGVAKPPGKMLVIHSTADPVFSPNETIAWFEALRSTNPAASLQTRLFLVPGMNHCSGGPATDRFDALEALERWVERGEAPSRITATVDPANPDVRAAGWPARRSRPLCPYPTRAIYRGAGADPEAAASFECR